MSSGLKAYEKLRCASSFIEVPSLFVCFEIENSIKYSLRITRSAFGVLFQMIWYN